MRKKIDENEKLRIQVVATHKQADILTKAAESVGAADRSTWMLAHCMKAAAAADTPGAPLVVSGEVADRLRAEADRQGITTDQVLAQFAIAGGVA